MPRTRQAQLDGIRVDYPRYYYPPGILRSSHGRCFLWSIRGCVHRVAREFQPDMILGSWAYPDGYAAVHLGKQLRIPVAVQVLGSDVKLLQVYPARQRATWKTLRAADGVITSSRDLADTVTAHGIEERKVSVVYRGVDHDTFSPGSKAQARSDLQLANDGPTLLFVGNLVPVKAVDVLITACAQLAAQFPMLQCHIIGDGPLRQQLEAQANAMSIARSIRFHGAVPHNQLPDWYRAADVVVLPSLSEGVPNVLREAIACHRPYVASATGGIPEISHHSACTLVPPGEHQPLANAIADRLRGDNALVNSMPETETWDIAGRKLGRILESIARSASSRDSAVEWNRDDKPRPFAA